MENNKRKPFYFGNHDYKTIKSIEESIDLTGEKLSDEKTKAAIERFQNRKDLLEYPNLDIKQETFSTDPNKFKDDCLELIEYVKQHTQSDVFNVLYLLRQYNRIKYGKYDKGTQVDAHYIEMVSDEDLKKLYELLQVEFSDNFEEGCKHTFSQGWSLLPTIGDNLMIDINSNSITDSNWIYEEAHKVKSTSPSVKM